MPTTKPLPADLVAAFPELELRSTVRLHPRPGNAVPGGNAIGGSLLWPKDEPWPRCPDHGDPLVSVLQLRSQEVPELAGPAGTQLFQLLWCPKAHDAPVHGPKIRTFWRREVMATEAAPPPPAPDADESFLPRSCRVWPERVVELPDQSELESSTVERLDRWITDNLASMVAAGAVWPLPDGADRASVANYQCAFSTAPGTKIGGFPQWWQYPEYPACDKGHRMDHLLTVACDEFDGGSWWRWLPGEERDLWDGPTHQRLAVQGGAFPFPGDGSVYVFVCRRCNEFPSVAIFQR
jgi:hypothetical protein